MQYGYFDNENKEYVITRPDTPRPWINYLGFVDYGAIITNNGGGYSFVKSGANGRLIRDRFNSVLGVLSGRYIYIRDMENGDYWSNTWLPVKKSLDNAEYICRHGIAYSKMYSRYDGIETETTYYIPLNSKYEVWSVEIKNSSAKKRKLSLFSFVELTNDSNENQDLVNLQYTLFISRTYYKDNLIVQTINENTFLNGKDVKLDPGMGGKMENRFLGVVGGEVVSFDGDREAFIGGYRSYSDPIAVESGKCSNSLNYGGNSCGATQVVFELQPGEKRHIVYLFGRGNESFARKIMKEYENEDKVKTDLNELKEFWNSKLERFKVKTPSPNFDTMVNIWNAYQCFITFFWSRAASLLYVGLRNGLGFRDTVQDIQGIMHIDSQAAKERLVYMLSGQVSNGAGLPLVLFDHKPQTNQSLDNLEYVKITGYTEYRCDDALWLFPTVSQYIKETGDISFLDEVVPYSDKGEDTVYQHLKKALDFSLQRLGKHGLVLGLDADWNDCLRLGEEGESVFASFQLYLGLKIFKEFAEKKGRSEDAKWAKQEMDKLFENIQKYAWEGDRFVRAFNGDEVIGSKKNSDASFWLNPQSWAVLSGCATEEQKKIILDNVEKILNTKYGAMICYPPFKNYGLPVARMILFLPGLKENASIFSQTQGWLIRAETMVGNGRRAFMYYEENNPANMNDKIEIRWSEPYVHCQFTEGKDSPFHGRANVHWLTGTASTMMVAAVEGILGIQPDYDGLVVDPCVPPEWKEFYIERYFRGKKLNIVVKNPSGIEKGVSSIIINGKQIKGNFIPLSEMKEENEVVVLMGK